MKKTNALRALFAPLAIALFLTLASSAVAANSPKLAGQVTDLTTGGKVNVSDPTITSSLNSLASAHGVTMEVLLADSMNGVDPGAYAKQVATDNNLGDHQALLVITFSDRQYGMWVGSGITNVGATDINNVLNGAVKQHLLSGDTAGAIAAGADGLGVIIASNPVGGGGNAATPAAGGNTTPVAPSAPQKPIDFSGFLLVCGILLGGIVVLLLVGTGALFFAGWLKSRKGASALAAKMDALSSAAAKSFVDTDEALKSADQEIDFAGAEFGDKIAAPYRQSLTGLQTSMRDISTLQAAVNDADFGLAGAQGSASAPVSAYSKAKTTLDEGEAEYGWNIFGHFFAARANPVISAKCDAYQTILDKTAAINKTLSAQMAQIANLRDLEKTLPKRVPGLTASLDNTKKAIAAAVQRALALSGRSKSAYKTVATNIDGARKLADLAGADLAIAQQAVSSVAPTGAIEGAGTLAAASAEGRIAKIAVLIGALDAMAKEVDTAAAALSGHLTSAKAEIDKAAIADHNNDVSGEEKTVAQAQALLTQARMLSHSDPYAADQVALAALKLADSVLDQVRDAVAARVRQEEAAKEAYAAAQRSLTQAQSYINSHRSVVNSSARSSLERANGQFAAYNGELSTAQMIAAAATMAAIAHDAESAYSHARSDVADHEASEAASSYSSHDTYSGGGFGGSSSGGSWGGGGGISSGGGFGGGGGTSSGGGW